MIAQIEFQSLSVDLTLRCNLKCAHCMRGDPEEKDLNLAAFENFIKTNHIRTFRMLWLNGGEVTMRIELIKELFRMLKRLNVFVACTGFNTNGTKLAAVDELLEWFMNNTDHNDIGMIRANVSADRFHAEALGPDKVAKILNAQHVLSLQYCDRVVFGEANPSNFKDSSKLPLIGIGRALQLDPSLYTMQFNVKGCTLSEMITIARRHAQFWSFTVDGKIVPGMDWPNNLKDEVAIFDTTRGTFDQFQKRRGLDTFTCGYNTPILKD